MLLREVALFEYSSLTDSALFENKEKKVVSEHAWKLKDYFNWKKWVNELRWHVHSNPRPKRDKWRRRPWPAKMPKLWDFIIWTKNPKSGRFIPDAEAMMTRARNDLAQIIEKYPIKIPSVEGEPIHHVNLQSYAKGIWLWKNGHYGLLAKRIAFLTVKNTIEATGFLLKLPWNLVKLAGLLTIATAHVVFRGPIFILSTIIKYYRPAIKWTIYATGRFLLWTAQTAAWLAVAATKQIVKGIVYASKAIYHRTIDIAKRFYQNVILPTVAKAKWFYKEILPYVLWKPVTKDVIGPMQKTQLTRLFALIPVVMLIGLISAVTYFVFDEFLVSVIFAYHGGLYFLIMNRD